MLRFERVCGQRGLSPGRCGSVDCVVSVQYIAQNSRLLLFVHIVAQYRTALSVAMQRVYPAASHHDAITQKAACCCSGLAASKSASAALLHCCICDSLNCCSHALSSPVISLRPPTSRRAHTKPCIAIGFLAHCAALFAPPQRWRASSHHCKPTIGMSSAATGSCVLLTAVCVSALSVILVRCKCVAKS